MSRLMSDSCTAWGAAQETKRREFDGTVGPGPLGRRATHDDEIRMQRRVAGDNPIDLGEHGRRQPVASIAFQKLFARRESRSACRPNGLGVIATATPSTNSQSPSHAAWSATV